MTQHGWDDEDEDVLAELEQERAAAADLVHETFDLDTDPPENALGEAVGRLELGLESLAGRFRRVAAVTGWGRQPPEEVPGVRRWLYCTFCVIEPHDLPPADDAEGEAAVAALTPADWIEVVRVLVEQGPGADASPAALWQALLEAGHVQPADEPVVLTALEVVVADWQALEAFDAERRLTPLGAWGLPEALHALWCADDDQDEPGVMLLAMREDWEERGDEWQVAEHAVARALVDLLAPAPLTLDLEDRAWAPFLRAVHERTGSASAAYLLACAAEVQGQVDRQQTWLDRALDAEAEHEPSLLTAAALASCRGEAAQARALLARAGVEPDDDELALLARYTRAPASGPSRNAPCACGSGRKHKLCCGARATAHPLPDRAPWLLQKAIDFARSLPHRDVLLQRALVAAQHDDEPYALLQALHADPLVVDAALHADGLLERFLEVRGGLLPEDERELAARWRETELALYAVLSTRPGTSVLLRRDGTQDDVEVRDRAASTSVRRGDLLLARLLPTGPGAMLAAVVAVPRSARGALAAALGDGDVYGAVADLRRPPTLANTDGHPLVSLVQDWELPDGGWDLLAAGDLETTEDPDTVLLLRDTRHVAATLTRTPSGVTVTVNSRERADEVARLVTEAVPGSVLVAQREDEPSLGVPVAASPEAGAALQEHLQTYEREWCDTEVPALGGRTPREAVRSEEGYRLVEDLLSDMPDSPNGMSARRLRALLDLPTPLR